MDFVKYQKKQQKDTLLLETLFQLLEHNRHTLSAIGAPSCKIAKFLVPRMNFITSNEFTAKNTFS